MTEARRALHERRRRRDIEDDEARCPELDCLAHGHVGGDATVDEASPVTLHGWEHPRNGGTGQKSTLQITSFETDRRPGIHIGGHGDETARHVLDAANGPADLPLDDGGESPMIGDRSSGAGQCGDRTESMAAQDSAADVGAGVQFVPQPSQTGGSILRVDGDKRSVERPDGASDDQVGLDLGLGQCLQHADLGRTERATARQHERQRTGPRRDRQRSRRGHGGNGRVSGVFIAAVGSTGYNIALLIHITSAFVAFAPAFVDPLIARRRPGAELLASMATTARRVYAPALFVTGFTGFAVAGLSDKLYSMSQPWLATAFVIWVAMNGVLHAVLIPAERANDQKKIEFAGASLAVMLVITLFLMTWKPGL